MTRTAAGVSVALLALIAACDSGPMTISAVRAGSDGGNAGAFPNVPRDRPFVVAAAPICINGTRPATITAVNPIKLRGHMRVVDWGVHNQRPGAPFFGGPGAQPGTTKQYGFVHAPVRQGCGRHRGTTLFDVNLVLSSRAATARGFMITYRIGDAVGSMRDPFNVGLCAGSHCPKWVDAAVQP